ncbi:PucR family transcriptional regulator [Bacillus velezensis]|uniref:PucR family transcriptional regulator n=1 Tax=Bacillus velezensis TaxID=492670 RepID=UPI003F7C4036
MNPLLAIYPRAVLSDTCCTAEDVFCFYDEKRRVYVAIPKEDITPKEKLLLESLLTPAEEKGDFFPETAAAKRWRRFLLEEGPVPDVKEPRVRFIHYDLLGERDWGAFTEALRHFWPVSYTVVRTGRDQGVIVEEEKLEAPDSDDIASFVKILEGDFYFSVRFFIGRYYGAGERLRLHYRREQQYCQIGRRYLPQLSTLTAETVFPAMLMEESREKLSALLHEEAVLLFQKEPELKHTIQTFIEHNSNMSLTSKRLHLHRNSLQYRIDKFAERSGIDIKTYRGALLAYFICLQYEKPH